MKTYHFVLLALLFSLSAFSLAQTQNQKASTLSELNEDHLRQYSYHTPLPLNEDAQSLPSTFAISINPHNEDQKALFEEQQLIYQRERDAEEGTLSADPRHTRALTIDRGEAHYFLYQDTLLLRGHTKAFYSQQP